MLIVLAIVGGFIMAVVLITAAKGGGDPIDPLAEWNRRNQAATTPPTPTDLRRLP